MVLHLFKEIKFVMFTFKIKNLLNLKDVNQNVNNCKGNYMSDTLYIGYITL